MGLLSSRMSPGCPICGDYFSPAHKDDFSTVIHQKKNVLSKSYGACPKVFDETRLCRPGSYKIKILHDDLFFRNTQRVELPDESVNHGRRPAKKDISLRYPPPNAAGYILGRKAGLERTEVKLVVVHALLHGIKAVKVTE